MIFGGWRAYRTSFQISVQSTIRAPTAEDSAIETPEDMAYAFGAGDFNFSGVDMNDTLTGVTVVTLPAEGTLTLDGSPVAANQTVTRADIDAGRLLYAPAANANGNGYTSFTFRVRDSNVASNNAYIMTVDVTPVSDPATGMPVVIGAAMVNATLTAGTGTIADDDGLPATAFPTGYTFQWVRVETEEISNPADIGDATSSLYTLTPDDVGKRVKVRVSFTDATGEAESLESEPTAVVATANANDGIAPRVISIVRQSPASSPTNADSLIWRVRFDEDVANVDPADFRVSGTTAQPTSVSEVTASTVYDVTVSGGDLTGLEATAMLEFAPGHSIEDAAGNTLADITPTFTNENTFVVDNTAPTLRSASVDGVTMVLTFSEALDADSVPGAGRFRVTVDKDRMTNRVAVSGAVTLDGSVATLTLAARAQVDGAVSLTYEPPTGPGARPFRDAAGNEVVRVQGRSIENVTRHGPPTNFRAVPGDRAVRLIWEFPEDGEPYSGYEVRNAEGASVPADTPLVWEPPSEFPKDIGARVETSQRHVL